MKNFALRLTIVYLIIITGCSKYPDLGNGYKLDSDGRYTLQIVNFENTIMVSSCILEYTFDSNFVILSQRPWDSIPGIKAMNYSESKKAFEKSSFRQYWIINKKDKSEYSFDSLTKLARYSNIYGPFTENEYLQKREELKISKELVLKDK